MLTNISWATYLTGIATLSIFYYAYVLVRYYRTDVMAFLNGRSARSASRNTSAGQATGQENPEEDQYIQVEAFAAEVREYIGEAYTASLDKEASLSLLKPAFQRYAALSHSPFRNTLNELIVSECAKHGAIILSEDDLEELWNEVA